jgi:DNA-binding transcriptional regulator YdaS (Cro superfamily)
MQSLTSVLHCFTLSAMAKKRDTALEHAIEAAGGVVALADAIGISKQAVSGWEQCPAERVLQVEAATKGIVSRYRLRPDIFGREVRAA